MGGAGLGGGEEGEGLDRCRCCFKTGIQGV